MAEVPPVFCNSLSIRFCYYVWVVCEGSTSKSPQDKRISSICSNNVEDMFCTFQMKLVQCFWTDRDALTIFWVMSVSRFVAQIWGRTADYIHNSPIVHRQAFRKISVSLADDYTR